MVLSARCLLLVCALAHYRLACYIMSQVHASYLRNSLMRTVYFRYLDDQIHRSSSHTHWYNFNVTQLPEDLSDKFTSSHQDEETTSFLEMCYQKADWIFTQLWHSLIKSVLGWFMTNTSINGFLGRGGMFVFSHDQLEGLLGIDPTWRAENMIDLGAGDGMVTMKMAKYFRNVFTTEVSNTMKERLKEKGFRVLDVSEWASGSFSYDLIGCLNLLDRCSQPFSMLQQIKESLRPGTGRAVIAVVLPFSPYVEADSLDHRPKEHLHVVGSTFEEQAGSFMKDVFEPAGFEVELFTRLPYLCEGDLSKSFYVLDDAVFILKVRAEV